MATFNLSNDFLPYTGGQSTVEIDNCFTVSECIEAFLREYPSCPPGLFYNNCSITTNGQDINSQQGYSTGCGASTSIGCSAGSASQNFPDPTGTGVDRRYQQSGVSGCKTDLPKEYRYRIFDSTEDYIEWQRENKYDPEIERIITLPNCPCDAPKILVHFWLPIIANSDGWSEVDNQSTYRRQE